MMRKKFILGMSLILFTISHAQVGINTDAPTTTLQIDGKDVATKVAGLLVPRFTGDEIFNMPISVAQGYAAASNSNYSNLVYATSAASVPNQASTGRGEFLTTSGFFYWDDPGQKWRRLFVASSSAAGNDGVVKIIGGSGGSLPSFVLPKGGNGYGAEQPLILSTPLTFAPPSTTSWPEIVGTVGSAAVMTPIIYDAGTGKFRENQLLGQVHMWRLVVRVVAGAGSSGSVMAIMRNPVSLFEINSIQSLPSGSNSSAGNILTFLFVTIADEASVGYEPPANTVPKGYNFFLKADAAATVEFQSLTRVSLFKD